MQQRYLKFIFVFIALILSSNIEAKIIRNIKSSTTPGNIIFIDSIDYRHSLTRVYARIAGRANTSMKIDEITGATDIDGIDFKRWFQFEKSGIISIEIDFPKKDINKLLTFDIISTIGTIKCSAESRK